MRVLLVGWAVISSVAAYLNPADVQSAAIANSSHTLSKRSSFYGRATWYDVETWVAGACGQYIDNDMHIVALNEPMYGDLDSKSKWCGQHIMIANGLKTAKAVIMDACPETKQCHHGALDMSMSLFQEFHDLKLGVFPITWWTISNDNNDNHHGSSSHSSSSSSHSSSSHSSSSSATHHSSSTSSKNSATSSTHSTDDQANASRSSKASAASASSASAMRAASSEAAAQSRSRASVASSRSSASSSSSASSASKSAQSSKHSSSSTASQSTGSTSSASSTSSTASSSSDSASGTNDSDSSDPQAGNLQNFVKVLNGLSMLVHAAAQGS